MCFCLVFCETIGSPGRPRPMSMMPSVRENCAGCSQNPKFICTFDTEHFFIIFYLNFTFIFVVFFSLFATFDARTGKQKAKQYTEVSEWERVENCFFSMGRLAINKLHFERRRIGTTTTTTVEAEKNSASSSDLALIFTAFFMTSYCSCLLPAD